jgi:hypothetical protein
MVSGSDCDNAIGAYGSDHYSGRDGGYRINVPAGKTLTVTLTRDASSTWDPAISIVTNCGLAGLTCLAASDGSTDTEIASWKNSSTQVSTVYILVDAWTSTEYGPYQIRADLT